MNKNFVRFAMYLFIFGFILIGCDSEGAGTSPSEGAGTSPSSQNSPVELTLWSFVPTHIQFYEDALNRWNGENPNKPIQLKTESYPFDQMHNNLLMALQSGVGAPDIVDISVKRFNDYLQGDIQLIGLNEIIEPVQDTFVQSRLDIYSKDNEIYGLPTHLGSTVMFYNKNVIDEAGVNVDEIVSWDDFVEIGKQVVKTTGKPMITIESSDLFTFWPMITQQKSDFFNENHEVTLDNDTNTKTLEFIHDMIYEHGIAEVAPGGNHHSEEYYALMSNNGVASVQMPTWYMSRFIDYMPELSKEIIIRPMPSWEEDGYRSAGMGGTGTAITNQSEQQEIAMEFLEFAKTTKQGNVQLWNILGFVPPRFDVWESKEILEGENKYYDYFGKDIFSTIDEIKDEIYPVSITDQSSDVTDLLNTEVFYKVLTEDSQSPKEALEEAANQLRQQH